MHVASLCSECGSDSNVFGKQFQGSFTTEAEPEYYIININDPI